MSKGIDKKLFLCYPGNITERSNRIAPNTGETHVTNKNLSPKNLLSAFNKNPKDAQTRALITECFGETACFVINNGKVDVDATVANQEFIADTDGTIVGALTFAEVLQEMAKRYEADPLTGKALLDGWTTDHPRVNWGPVSEELRLVAAYAVESGQLPTDANSESVIDALLREPLRAPWPRLKAEWIALAASTKPADVVRAVNIRARLVFDKGSAPTAAMATSKKGKVSDPALQQVLDLNPPAPQPVKDDDRRRNGVTRKEWIQIDAWGCSLDPDQYHAVLQYVTGGRVPDYNWIGCLTSQQGPNMNKLAQSERGRERIQNIWDALR